MLALGIRYLNGFVAATEPESHERAEWPPHPARVFMALAAAHFQTAGDAAEREALLWLEAQEEAPALRASGHLQRAVVTHYVPVNDKAGDVGRPPTAIIQSLPELARDRKERTFARAWLDEDTAYLVWPHAEPSPAGREALKQLCAKVSRVGHSTSLVQMWVAADGEVGGIDWTPDELRGTLQLRVARPGTLAELERQYNAAAVEEYADLLITAEDDRDRRAQQAARRRLREEFQDREPPRFRPRIATYQAYARAAGGPVIDAAPGTVFSPHPLILTLEREDGPYRHLDLLSTLAVVERWRDAILSYSNDLPGPVRELLSGHGSDGSPREEPHLAFLPLAFVGHPHADGRLLGMGLVLPRTVPPDHRRTALQAIGRVRRLALGRLGAWRLQAETGLSPAWNLRPEVWTAADEGATHWSTVTPVVFDRHPKAGGRAEYQSDVAAMIATACMRIGLPDPREVIVTQVSVHVGVPPAFQFPRLRRKDGSERRHAHAIVVFDRPVLGPVLIGAGRYRGYGALRPIRDLPPAGPPR